MYRASRVLSTLNVSSQKYHISVYYVYRNLFKNYYITEPLRSLDLIFFFFCTILLKAYIQKSQSKEDILIKLRQINQSRVVVWLLVRLLEFIL